jgi:hypothetical protein
MMKMFFTSKSTTTTTTTTTQPTTTQPLYTTSSYSHNFMNLDNLNGKPCSSCGMRQKIN